MVRSRHGAAETGAVEAADCLDVIDAIFSTRAIRRFKPDPVPDDVIWAILDAAIRGPSSGNVQRWAWIVIQDQASKATIGRWYEQAWDGLGGGRRARLKAVSDRLVRSRAHPRPRTGTLDPNLSAGDHLARHIADAPLWIIAAQRGVKGNPTLVDGADIYGAIQNLMLAARRYGLGSTLTMLHRQRERDVGRLLGLPRDVCTVALIPLGYPDRQAFSTPNRKPVDSVTHWGRWGVQQSRPVIDIS